MCLIMTVEKNPSEQTIQDVYDQIGSYDDTPGELTSEEKAELTQKYQEESQEINQEASVKITELKEVMAVFEEYLSLDENSVKKVQEIISIPKQQRDWKFWPKSFEKFLTFKNDLLFNGGLKDLLEKYEELEDYFNALSLEERKELQRVWGKDGVYGPKTFAHMLGEKVDINNSQAEEVIDPMLRSMQQGTTEVLPDREAFIEAPAPVYNNGLEMSDDDFRVLRDELVETGENPSYNEFKTEVRQLSRNDKMQLQEVVWAKIDGVPWKGTYTHYMKSKIKEAGFSISEAVTFKKISGENTQEQMEQINTAFDIDLSELPTVISKDDRVSYEPNYGILIVVDNETGELQKIDVAEWTFDTIESTFNIQEWNDINRDTIFLTLDQLKWNQELQVKYIEALKEYIHQHEAYSIAREIFCALPAEEKNTWVMYTLDFRGLTVLSNLMVAQDIFWDSPYLLTQDATYINRQQPKIDFNTFDGNRLSISTWKSILMPNEGEVERIQKVMETLEREREIREAVELKLEETIRSENKQAIQEYLTLSTVSEREKQEIVRSIKEVVFEQKLFSQMRTMFTTQEGEEYTFNPWNDFLGEKLTAFDIFWDYKTLISDPDNTNYHSITEKDYTHSTQGRLSLISGETTVTPKEWSQRSEEGYEELSNMKDINRYLENRTWGRHLRHLMQRVENLERKPLVFLSHIRERKTLVIQNGKIQEIWAIYGRGTTPRSLRYATHMNLSNIPNGDASNGGKSATVLGCAFDMWDTKHVHGVAEWRSNTKGCVWLNTNFIHSLGESMRASASISEPTWWDKTRDGNRNWWGWRSEESVTRRYRLATSIPVMTV